MKRIVLVITCMVSIVYAAQVDKDQATSCVTGWLNASPRAMGVHFNEVIAEAASYDDDGYYVISLQPEGYVVVSGDDRFEPIVAFSPTGTFDKNPQSPLRKMLATGTKVSKEVDSSTSDMKNLVRRTEKKWLDLEASADGNVSTMGLTTISDVCIEPLVQSKWGQLEVCGNDTYNLYTPSNYPSGCVATSMAQLMRYYQYPDFPIGQGMGVIYIDGSVSIAQARGADGLGGAYDWTLMDLEPDCETSLSSREQIGALCYDAGTRVRMYYTSEVSAAYTDNVPYALLNTFGYAQACYLYNTNSETVMSALKSNLNAGAPVILGLFDEDDSLGHSVICDGYGYNLGTQYYHLNMGWDGAENLWYNLPSVSIFDIVDEVIYNVFPDFTGGIISGRVTTFEGGPIEGAVITTGSISTYSDANGIYSFAGVPAGEYVLTAEFPEMGSLSAIAVISTNGEIWCNTSDTNFSYGQITYQASFLPGEHGVITAGLSVQNVPEGESAMAPTVSADTGWYFIGWDSDFSSITADVTITAQYSSALYSGDDFELRALSDYYVKSGNVDWKLDNNSHQGSYSVCSGFISNDEETTIEVTVIDAAKVSFWKKVSSEEFYDFLEFYIDGVNVGTWSGQDDVWSEESFLLTTTEPHSLKWTYKKDASYSVGDDCAWIDDICVITDYTTYTVTFDAGAHGSITSGQATQIITDGSGAVVPEITADEGWHFTGWDTDYLFIEGSGVITATYSNAEYCGDDFETRAISDYYSNSGDNGWIISNQAHQGTYSMRSGNIFDGQESTIEITVSGVASVNFWKKVSSEKYFDLLEFSIDGSIKGRWAGEDEDWSYVSFAINPFEPHRLKWKYSKDACYYMGDDCAYIDDITFETEFTTHTVTFDAGTYGYISSGQAVQTVASGYSAKAPAVTPGLSWHFSGWDVDYSCVTSDLIVNALYSHLAYDGDDFESGTVDSLYQMSGDTGWLITDTAYSGTSAICSGVISDNQTSGFEISAPRAMGISFWLLVSCEEGYDWLNFYIDGVLQKSWSGVENVWSKETFLVPGIGSHTFTWTYVKDEIYFNGNDCVYIDDIVIKTAPIAYYGDSFETGEIAELYTAPDDVPWGITTTSYSGNYAVKCGATAVDTVSSIEVPVSGASAVSFRKLLDSVADHAWLRFYIDGALATEWSGQDSAWTLESYQLSPDVSHVLKWSYIKGSTQIGGTDSAFIDDILITVAADITGDNVVGIDDLFTMSDKWLSQDCAADNCAGADMNQDGFVGIEDFALLASSWLEQF